MLERSVHDLSLYLSIEILTTLYVFSFSFTSFLEENLVGGVNSDNISKRNSDGMPISAAKVPLALVHTITVTNWAGWMSGGLSHHFLLYHYLYLHPQKYPSIIHAIASKKKIAKHKISILLVTLSRRLLTCSYQGRQLSRPRRAQSQSPRYPPAPRTSQAPRAAATCL